MCEEVEESDEMEFAAVVRSDGRPPPAVVVLQVGIEVERVFGGARGGKRRQEAAAGSGGGAAGGRKEHMRWGWV